MGRGAWGLGHWSRVAGLAASGSQLVTLCLGAELSPSPYGFPSIRIPHIAQYWETSFVDHTFSRLIFILVRGAVLYVPVRRSVALRSACSDRRYIAAQYM